MLSEEREPILRQLMSEEKFKELKISSSMIWDLILVEFLSYTSYIAGYLHIIANPYQQPKK